MRAPLQTVLSVLSPLLVLTGAAAWLVGEDARPLTPEAAALDASLARAAGPPGAPAGVGILLVGNSKSSTDVDAAALGKALGYERPVANVNVGGSSAPAWYAMLEQRVFANDHRPELVIVYGQLSAMLRVQASSGGERKGVENQLTTASPVLDAKVLGNSSGPLGRARRRATAAHDQLLSGVRDLAVGLLVAPPHTDGVLAAGRATAEPALATMFGSTARFVAGGAARVVPVAEVEASEAMTASDGPPEASLIPDLVALVRAHEAKIVFVRAPLPPSSQFRDSLSIEVEGAALDLFNTLDASYIDLHAVDLPAGAFLDDYHLSAAGRAAVTTALAAALTEADVLNGGIARARPALIAASITRVGALPTAPPLTYVAAPDRPCVLRGAAPDLGFLSDDTLVGAGFGRASPLVLVDAAGPLLAHAPGKGFGDTCGAGWRHRAFGVEVTPRAAPSADGLALAFATELVVPDDKGAPVWWVYPDTRIEWRYDTLPSDGPLRISVTARAARGADARLRVGDTEVTLYADGRLLRGTIDVPPGALPAPWTLSVAAGADTWLVIDELLLGTQRVIGEPATTINPFARRGTPATDPLPLPTGPPGTDGVRATLPVPGFSHVADDVLRDRIDYPCSPIQVAPVGEPDGWITQAHKLVTMLQPGRRGFTHVGDTLLLAPPSAGAPGVGMPAGPYQVRLDPTRRCGAGTWLYPGDELAWPIPYALASKLRLGADTIVLRGIALLPEHDDRDGAALLARVKVTEPNKDQLVEGEVELPAAGGLTEACFRFDTPLPPNVRMELTLGAPDPDAWFIVWAALIGESEHIEGCDR